MPHQCVRCGTIYEEPDVILKGCSKCKCRLFYFFKEKPRPEISLSAEQVKEIEAQIKKIIGDAENEVPVVLDLETVRAIKPGKYEIDLVKLFKGHPVIFKVEDGKYVIDLATTFQLMKKD